MDSSFKPLLDLPDYQTKWESFISFDPFKIHSYWCLGNVNQYKSYWQMLSWTALSTERPPNKIPKSFDIVANSYVPHCAILYFDLVPIHFQFLDALVLWLRFWGVNVRTKIGGNRQEIMFPVCLVSQVQRPHRCQRYGFFYWVMSFCDIRQTDYNWINRVVYA